ncbi:MAG: ABC transporter ATP-binding protein [Nitrospiraceae bacterium]
MSIQTNIIQLRAVSKTYDRGPVPVQALRDVTLSVGAGEYLALTGPSGCGKSTLLNLVAGLDRPTSGDILVNGHSTGSWSSLQWTRARRDLIGIVFQAFHLLPALTAEENVAMPLLLSGGAGRSLSSRVEECLELVGLRDRARHRPNELSGGEQQRVAIARGIVHGPRLLIADEPTGNLDSRTAEEILALLRSLPHRFGCTIMLATHSDAAARQADRLCRMQDGSLHEEPSTVMPQDAP